MLILILALLFLSSVQGFFQLGTRPIPAVFISSQNGRPIMLMSAAGKRGRDGGSDVRGPENDDLSSLRSDETKLSAEEAERLSYIRRITEDADNLVKAAGFTLNGGMDEDQVERDVKDTKWSGQSDLDVNEKTQNNWNDVFSRKDLAFVDATALMGFAAIGRGSHAEGMDIFGILATSLPFLCGWFLVSPLMGSYSRAATKTKGAVPPGLVLGWATSMPIALGIRGLLKGTVPPIPFIVISLVATFVSLCAFRYLYISLVGGTSDDETKDAGVLEVFKMVGSLIKRW